MDLDRAPRLLRGTPRYVTPVLGNYEDGCVCRVAGKNASLYAFLNRDTHAFEVWRTTSGWETIATRDASVAYLSTIMAAHHPGGRMVRPAAIWLGYIGDTIYASLYAKSVDASNANGIAHSRLYRDTSPDRDGSGPWVLHGSFATDGLTFENPTMSDAHSGDGGYGGAEVLRIFGGALVTAAPFWKRFDTGFSRTVQKFTLQYSLDDGATWGLCYVGGPDSGEPVNYGWASLDSGGQGSTRNFGLDRSRMEWFIGASGNTSHGRHFSIPAAQGDAYNWVVGWNTAGPGMLSTPSGSRFDWPMSSPEGIHSIWSGPTIGDGESRGHLRAARPSYNPDGEVLLDLSAVHGNFGAASVFARIGTDAARRPVIVTTSNGLVAAITPLTPDPTRLHPRDDGLGLSAGPRLHPATRGASGGRVVARHK